MKPSSTWMPFYVGDYLRDTIGLNLEQHGAYLLSIFAYWSKGGPLTDAEAKAIMLQASHSIKRFYSVTGKIWRHKRVDEELKRARALHTLAVQRAKKGALARWNKGQSDVDNTAPKASVNDASSNAQSMSQAMLADAPSQSQVPKKDLTKLSKAFAKPKLTPNQKSVAERFEGVLNDQWLNDRAKWFKRIRSDCDRCQRVVAEVESATKEGRIQETPGQYAEYTWEIFKSKKA